MFVVTKGFFGKGLEDPYFVQDMRAIYMIYIYIHDCVCIYIYVCRNVHIYIYIFLTDVS